MLTLNGRTPVKLSIMNKLISLLFALIIPACFALSPITPVLAAGNVDLTLGTATQSVKLGDIFDVVIQAQSGSQEVVGADVFLDFDPSRLEVVDARQCDRRNSDSEVALH